MPDKRDALREFEDRVRDDPEFSDDDLRVVRRVIVLYRGAEAGSKVARIIVVGLAGLAGAIAAWDVVMAKMRAAWFGG